MLKKLWGIIALVFFLAGVFCLFIAVPFVLGLTGGLPAMQTIADGKAQYEKAGFYSRFAELKTSRMYQMDYVIETAKTIDDTEIQRKNTSFYAYAVLDDGIILVELPMDQWGKPFKDSYKGVLRRNTRPNYGMPPDYFLAQQLSDSFGLSVQAILEDKIAEFYLDTTGMESGKMILAAGMVMLLVSLGIVIWLVSVVGRAKRISGVEKISAKQFAEKYKVPPQKCVYMAIAAIYKGYPTDTVECVKLFWAQEEFDVVGVSSMFKRDWGVFGHDTSIDRLDWLLNTGNRTEAGYRSKFEEYSSSIKNLKSAPKPVKMFYRCVSKIRTSRGKTGFDTKYINQEYLQNCQSINAWDYVRGFNLASVCYTLGYITEQEVWHYFEAFGELIRQEFTCWEELAVSFLVGRFIWSNEPDQGKYVLHISSLFSYYKETASGDKKYNLWKKYSLSDLPVMG